MKKPLVSIIVPTYNRSNLLSKTLDSLFSQTFSNFEIIVVDDGSPGNENKILCNQYPKIRYIKIENSGGPSKPRNVGIKMAKGEYLAFVDDDDLWLPNKLEKQVQILNENLDFGLVHCYCRVIDEKGNKTDKIIGRPGKSSVKHGNVQIQMAGNWTLMMPTPLVRKIVIDEVGYFNEQMPQAGEDVEYWVRCSFYTKFYYLDEALVLYRKHDSNSEKVKNEYILLPLYLKKVIDNALNQNLINKTQHKILNNNLVRMQIKSVRKDKLKTFNYLFKLNPFWFLKFGNIKLLIKKLST